MALRRGWSKARNALELAADVGGAIGLVALVVAAVVGLASVVVGLAASSPFWVAAGGGFMAGGAATTGIALVVVGRRSYDTQDQLGYRWLSAAYTYTVDEVDPHFHRQRVDVEICALRDGVRTFTNQYLWSGTGVDDRPEIISAHQYLMGPVARTNGWTHYAVRLHPVLRRGETTTVSILQRLIDSEETFDCYLAKTLHERLDRLVLRVELPAVAWPDQAWRVAKQGRGAAAVELSREPVPLGAPGQPLEWVVERPVFQRSYEIEWSYADREGMYAAPPARGGTVHNRQ